MKEEKKGKKQTKWLQQAPRVRGQKGAAGADP
jgi:hypothetical protein